MVITQRTQVPPRYRLIEEVGQGGMAVVYRAQDESLGREVAIKVLHGHLSTEPESRARLAREARAVAKLRHDNILEIFDYSAGEAAEESAYIVTEFIDGCTLKDFLAKHQVRHPEIAALLAAELTGALVHAHALGIIHRDIKPENVMIRKDGVLKLTDFGIAQVIDLERMTVTGQLLGSPAYMAPELIEGKPLDVRTDLFSIGILLYQMATATLPFSGKNPHEVLRRITDGKFADPRTLNRLIGAGLWRIMTRALARQPDDRYPTAEQLLVDLREFLADAGLGDVRAELRQYFADPAGYESSLGARMAAALVASGEAKLAARATNRALECWNRVLAFAPNHEAVNAAMRRFEGRHRRKVFAAAAAGALVVGLGAWATARLVAHVGPDATTDVAPDVAMKTASVAAAGPRTPPPVAPATSPKAAAGGTATGASPTPEPSPSVGHDIDKTGGPPPGEPPTSMPNPEARIAKADRARHVVAMPHREKDERSSGEPAEAEAPTAAAAAGAKAGAGADDKGAPGPRPKRAVADGKAAAAGTAAAAPTSRSFALGPTPQNVDVYLDGVRQFAYDMDHRSLEVPWDRTHVVEFRSPSGCCFVARVEVGPDRTVPAENIIARILKWKPARLVVTTTPNVAGTRILVRDPSRPGRGIVVGSGEEANIPFLPTDDGQKDVEVEADSGHGFTTGHVTVRAGQRSSMTLKLGNTGTTP